MPAGHATAPGRHLQASRSLTLPGEVDAEPEPSTADRAEPGALPLEPSLAWSAPGDPGRAFLASRPSELLGVVCGKPGQGRAPR